jgi:GNAT superfamily N-acetyltransferase
MRRWLSDVSKDILGRGLDLEINIKGSSMYPFLKDGDRVKIKKTDASKIKLGDLIYAEISDGVVIHRVIGKRNKEKKIIFITKGDANLFSVEKIYPENILGKIISIKRRDSASYSDIELRNLERVFHFIFSRLQLFFFRLLKKAKFYFVRYLLFNIQSQYIYKKLFGRLSERDVAYRLATSGDDSSLAILFRARWWPVSLQALKEYYSSYLDEFKDRGYFVVAQLKDRIIGCVGVKEKDNFWLGEILYVHWKYRRKGVGTQLLNYLIKNYLENEFSRLPAVKIIILRRDFFAVRDFLLDYCKKNGFQCRGGMDYLRLKKIETADDEEKLGISLNFKSKSLLFN